MRISKRVGAAIVAALSAVALGGCLDQIYGWHYDRTQTGELKGTLRVTWVGQDSFLYEPDPVNPLYFKRADGTVIQPATMFTDGGTIPMALRAIKSYSPWGYAPAFIIHDWLFVMKQCQLPGYEKYDLEAAAVVMAEAVKSLMENPKVGAPNKLVHYSMYEGVRSATARDYWDNGKCNPAGAPLERAPSAAKTRSLEAPSSLGGPPVPKAALPSFTITLD